MLGFVLGRGAYRAVPDKGPVFACVVDTQVAPLVAAYRQHGPHVLVVLPERLLAARLCCARVP